MNTNSVPWKGINGGVSAPVGFYACGVKSGVKYKGKYDLAIILSEVRSHAAGVFTRNVVKAHPLLLTQKHIEDGQARAVIVNSGNDNACMGERGDQDAWQMAETTSLELGIDPSDVLVASTGVIGQPMPMKKIVPGIKAAVAEVKSLQEQLSLDNCNCIQGSQAKIQAAHQAALAIMTTDTTVKEMALELKCAGGTVKLGVMAKGSGMIHPNMGTMLCFITTDAQVESSRLKELLQEATDESFNMVTVDGDTSTNDMVLMLANGLSGVRPEGEDWQRFSQMVKEACCAMARAIARDGEGASKFIEVRVSGAKDISAARTIARSVCSSSLVKAAMYGQDANWGRILAAAGYSGASFNPNQVDIFLNGLQVASQGQGVNFSEDEALVRLTDKDILVEIHLGDGEGEAKAWGCDLTHKYIDINADYRT